MKKYVTVLHKSTKNNSGYISHGHVDAFVCTKCYFNMLTKLNHKLKKTLSLIVKQFQDLKY
jgi:hypothetical protein